MPLRIVVRALLCVILAIPIVAAPRQQVTFGVNEGTTAGQMQHEMAGALAQLQTSPSIDVKLRVFPNHDALAAALQRGDVDLAFLGAVKYVEAHFLFGATPVVAECCSVRSFLPLRSSKPPSSCDALG